MHQEGFNLELHLSVTLGLKFHIKIFYLPSILEQKISNGVPFSKPYGVETLGPLGTRAHRIIPTSPSGWLTLYVIKGMHYFGQRLKITIQDDNDASLWAPIPLPELRTNFLMYNDFLMPFSLSFYCRLVWNIFIYIY